MSGWIGVDLDGTLAEYAGWQGPNHIGKPVPAMLERVKTWLLEGREVRIFTARVACAENEDPTESEKWRTLIQEWCRVHVGQELPVTNKKDYGMIALYDDRCVQVEMNTGKLIGREP